MAVRRLEVRSQESGVRSVLIQIHIAIFNGDRNLAKCNIFDRLPINYLESCLARCFESVEFLRLALSILLRLIAICHH